MNRILVFLSANSRNKSTQVMCICAFFMALFLPLFIAVSNIFLILFFVTSAYVLCIKKERSKRSIKLFYGTTVLIFILYCLGLFFTEDPKEALKTLERSVSFILCPSIIFFHTQSNIQSIRKSLFRGLFVGSLVSILFLLCHNFYRYFQTRPLFSFDNEILSYYHSYYYFTEPLDIHPSYLGVYILFSIVLLLKTLLQKKLKTIQLLGMVLLLLLLSAGIIFINSRVILLLFSMVVSSGILYYAWTMFNQKRWKPLVLVSAGAMIAIFMLGKGVNNTFLTSRLTKELSWELSHQKDTKYNSKISADSRIARWSSAIKVIKQKPLLGHGTRSEKNVLADAYLADGLESSYHKRYDAHSIYLSFAIEYGIIGLLVLLFYFLSNLFVAAASKDILYISFFIIIMTMGVFESHLKNNAAITWVAFFSAIFFFSNQKELGNE